MCIRDRAETEAEPETQNPFTPDGTGTVVDNATDEDGKEFYTITTADESVFYLTSRSMKPRIWKMITANMRTGSWRRSQRNPRTKIPRQDVYKRQA